MMKRSSCIIPLLLGLCLAFTTLSCQHREENYEVPKPKPNTWLSVAVDDMCEELDTKSILDGGIETKLTNLTVAVYDGSGSLYDTKNITAGFDNLEYSFTPDETYRIYALANMGDMTSAFPPTYSASAVENITYTIPGYTTASTGVNERGIPMAGSLTFVAGVSEDTVIPLTRLFAKLNVHLACNWPGNITSVKVRNLNAKLKPFGTSAAASSSDVLAEEEVEVPATSIISGDFVFYIPENRQGTISGITSSAEKISNEKSSIASYLETVVTGQNAYSYDGTITFRSYLGNNATSDFNIVRNNRYVWSIGYYPDGMTNDDWKHENDMSWSRYTFTRDWPSVMYLNREDYFTTYAHSDNYVNGALVTSTSPDISSLPSGITVNWSVSPTNRLVANTPDEPKRQYFHFTSTSAGTAHVTQTIFDGFENNEYAKDVTVLDFARDMYLEDPDGNKYYDDETMSVPYGTTLTDMKVGCRRTTSSGVSYICPVVCGSGKLTSISVSFPSHSNYLLTYYDFRSEDVGKQAVFSYTFNDTPPTSWNQHEFRIFAYYNDYGSDDISLACRVPVSYEDVWSVRITPETSNHDIGGTQTYSAAVYKNGSIQPKGANISWDSDSKVSLGPPSVSSYNIYSEVVAEAVSSGTGTITASFDDGNPDHACSATATMVINASADVITYRLDVDPSSKSVQKGGNFSVNEFTVYKEKWVNESYDSRTAVDSGLSWSIASGSDKISLSGSTVTGSNTGSGTLRVTSSDIEIESSYRSADVTVTVTAAPDVTTYQYKVVTSVSPASIKVGESSTASATKYKKTFVNGVATTGWVEEGSVTSSGFVKDSGSGGVSISGYTISATSAGSAVIKSSYAADEYENATLTISDADYSISISPSSGVDLILGKKTTQNYTASATKNGSAATDGAYEWTVSSDRVSLSSTNTASTTATAVSAGDVTLTATYKVGGVAKASASVTFTVYSNSLSLDLNKTSIAVNETSDATVTYTSNGTNTNVTSASTLTAYAASTGSTTSSIVTINSNGVITGASAGDCWIEASYTSGGYTYTSSRVKLTVTNNPLTLSWKDNKEPTYVSQRGKIEVSGLDDPSATLTYEDLNKNIIFTDSYGVSFTADDYNIKVTASNGQVGYLTGTIKAPVLTPSSTTLYVNPDGSEAMSGTDGLSGNPLSVCYKNESGNVTFLISTDTDDSNLATGSNLHPYYYTMLLEPRYSSNASIVTVTSGGSIYANDVYDPTTGTLATVTISPYNMGSSSIITEVASTSLTIKGVNPFTDWESEVITLPDEQDFGLINKYRAYASHSYSGHSATFGTVSATTGRHGIEVFRNGSVLASGNLKNCFTNTYNSTDGWHTSYTLSESALSEHVGGLLELKGYVQNSHSGNRIYKAGAKLGVYVNGAIGAKMTGIGTNVVKISTAWVGDEASYGFNMVSGYNLVATKYHSGDSFGYISNTTVQNVPAEGTSLNAVVYELHREGATLNSAMEIMEAEKPRFEFLNVTGVGVFNTDGLISYYYLRPSGTPTVNDHGYYRLWLLESIAGMPGSGPKEGWILDD